MRGDIAVQRVLFPQARREGGEFSNNTKYEKTNQGTRGDKVSNQGKVRILAEGFLCRGSKVEGAKRKSKDLSSESALGKRGKKRMEKYEKGLQKAGLLRG